MAKPSKVSISLQLKKKSLTALSWHSKSSSMGVQTAQKHHLSVSVFCCYHLTLHIVSLPSKLSYLLFPIHITGFPSLNLLLNSSFPLSHPSPTHYCIFTSLPSFKTLFKGCFPQEVFCIPQPEVAAPSSDPPPRILVLCPCSVLSLFSLYSYNSSFRYNNIILFKKLLYII